MGGYSFHFINSAFKLFNLLKTKYKLHSHSIATLFAKWLIVLD